MYKKYKLIILILFLGLMTGCAVDYDVKINLDGSIVEEVIIEGQKEDFKDSEDTSFSEKNFTKQVKGTLETLNIEDQAEYEIKYDKSNLKVTVKMKYDDLEDYKENSKAFEKMFEDLNIDAKNIRVKLKTENGEFFESNKLLYDQSVISIRLPYEVKSSNANSFNEDENVYTWVVDDSFEGIELEYSSGKLYTEDILKIMPYATYVTYFNLAIFVIISLLVILIIYLGIKLFIKERRD